MATDPEVKTLLAALVSGQVKLADGQERLVKSHEKLARGQDELRKEMARGHDEMVRGHQKLEAVIERVVTRLDWFGEQVVRGFTHGVARDAALDKRLTKLERQFASFKKRSKKPRRH